MNVRGKLSPSTAKGLGGSLEINAHDTRISRDERLSFHTYLINSTEGANGDA